MTRQKTAESFHYSPIVQVSLRMLEERLRKLEQECPTKLTRAWSVSP